MVEIKKAVATDPWETSQDTWQYVTIPEDNPLGHKFPTIRLNKYNFEPGQTYKVPVPVAATVNDRIKVYNRSCVRLLQPEMAQPGIVKNADGSMSTVAPTI